MFLKISLILSVLLQFGAVFLAFGLIKRSKFSISWILISSAFLLMAIRRLFEFFMIINSQVNEKEALLNSWIAVIISSLIFIGTFYIRQIFDLQKEIDRLREENEAKILSAVITAEENERSKTAKELHDGLAPLLSTTKMFVTAIDKEKTSNNNLQVLNKMEEVVDSSIITLKEISNNVSPHILNNLGLDVAIKKYINNINISPKIKINFVSYIKNIRFDNKIEIVLYRVLCELITNSIKHSKCKKINDKTNFSIMHIASGATQTDSTERLFFTQTSGMYFETEFSILKFSGDCFYQFGKNNQRQNVNAFLFDFETTLKMNNVSPSIGISYISGDNNLQNNSDKMFNNLYGARHRFFGHIDYFSNSSSSTNYGGLADYFGKINFKLSKKLQLNQVAHYFRLSETNINTPSDKNLGFENDFQLKYKFNDWGELQCEYCFFLPTNSLKTIQNVQNDKFSQFFYVQLHVIPCIFVN